MTYVEKGDIVRVKSAAQRLMGLNSPYAKVIEDRGHYVLLEDGHNVLLHKNCIKNVSRMMLITVVDNVVTVTTPHGTGVARCNPEDKSDLPHGIAIALKRIERSAPNGNRK